MKFSIKFSFILSLTPFLITLLLLHLLSPSSCLLQQPPDSTLANLLSEEKTRLGSTPPSCHNRCNQCHPCMAVQVPTLPSHNRVQPRLSQRGTIKSMDYHDQPIPSSVSNKYSNYKPLNWKCRCNNHFYNP